MSALYLSSDEENDPLEDFTRIEKRLIRYKLEFTTLSQQTHLTQRKIFRGWQKIERDKSEVLSQTRKGVAIDREVRKYEDWVKAFNGHDIALAAWLNCVTMVDNGDDNLMSSISNAIFDKLKQIIHNGGDSEILTFYRVHLENNVKEVFFLF